MINGIIGSIILLAIAMTLVFLWGKILGLKLNFKEIVFISLIFVVIVIYGHTFNIGKKYIDGMLFVSGAICIFIKMKKTN